MIERESRKQQYTQDFLRAGAVAREVRAFGKALIGKGASYQTILRQIHQKILALGALPAFPPQMALNDVAAHFLPHPEQDIIFSDELVKLDIGVCYNGAIGDCAVTVDLSGKYQKLIDSAEAALLAAEKSVAVGVPVREIGRVIAETIASYGFTSVKNLSGHGLGYFRVHTEPLIPNYEDTSKAVIQSGMTFAIEPFATDGKGMIFEAGDPMIFSLLAVRPVRSSQAKQLLTKIHAYKGLPFAMGDLVDIETPLSEVQLGLHELLQAKVIVGYPPLIEETHGMVAQAENSILVDSQGHVLVTTR